eukprot:g20663.t1
MELEVHVHNDICARDYEVDPPLCAADKLEYILSVAMQWVQQGKLEFQAAAGPPQEEEEEQAEQENGSEQDKRGPSAPSERKISLSAGASATLISASSIISNSASRSSGSTGQPIDGAVEEGQHQEGSASESAPPPAGDSIPAMGNVNRVPVTMSDLATFFTLLKVSADSFSLALGAAASIGVGDAGEEAFLSHLQYFWLKDKLRAYVVPRSASDKAKVFYMHQLETPSA